MYFALFPLPSSPITHSPPLKKTKQTSAGWTLQHGLHVADSSVAIIPTELLPPAEIALVHINNFFVKAK